MKYNPVVSFKASFPHEQAEGSPAGRELAEHLVQILKARGLGVTGPDDHDGYAWDVNWLEGRSGLMAVVQYVGDDPEEWLIETHSPSVPFLTRGRSELARQRVNLVRRFCEALHELLSGDARVGEIRWYSKDQVYEVWSELPADALNRFG